MLSSRALRVVRRSMGRKGIGRINAETRGEALEAHADDCLGISRPTRDGEEATVHVEGRAGAWAAEVGRRGEADLRVVELERLACEQVRHALRDHLVAEPFALAEALPAVAPVGLEAVSVADAFEFRDVVEHRSEPGDKSIKRPGPAWGLAFFICVVGFRDGHGQGLYGRIFPRRF
jgi:hypothetical protein